MKIGNVVRLSPSEMIFLHKQMGSDLENTLKICFELLEWKQSPENTNPSFGEYMIVINDTAFMLGGTAKEKQS